MCVPVLQKYQMYVLNRSEECFESVEHSYDQEDTPMELDQRHWRKKNLRRPFNGIYYELQMENWHRSFRKIIMGVVTGEGICLNFL